ncbi:MAG TPA: Nramp family divalent metal transporter [Candidatus Dormibacteraeota bacterium]|nr:Nramp family divalent metal transporter [Candidatus Dormibacteraeota bacterium]
MRDENARHREDDPESDVGPQGAPIEDPLLRLIPAGPDREPDVSHIRKQGVRAGAEADTGGPPAGRMSLEEARRKGLFGWLQVLGPGLITGASDDDPSGIGTYSQVGSQFGYGLLWTALLTFPLMAAVQELCARIALHTGVGLATSLRRRFPSWLVGLCIAALFVANTVNVGADLGAVAAGGSLLTRGAVPQIWLLVPVAVLVLGMQVFLTYATIFKVFKWLTLVLFAYVLTGFVIHPDLRQIVVASIVPHIELNRDYVAALVAIFGTTISPYLFFWQASSEVDEMRAAGKSTEVERRGVRIAELKAARVDIMIGMFFSQLVMYFIIATTAATLHAHGKTDVQTADQAAQALAPLAGQWAFVLFALGMIGTGLLAMPILTGSAAYAVRDFFGLKGALADKPMYRPTFYGIMALATLAGLAMNLVGINPIRALFVTAIINGLVAPPLMVLIVLLGSSHHVMGRRVSGPLSKALCWAATAVMGTAAVALVVTSL